MFWSGYEKSKGKDIIEDESASNPDKAWVLRFYTVFNLSQIEGIPDPDDAIEDLSLTDNDLCENPRVMEFVGKTGAIIKEGNTPCYIPSADRIEIPSIKTRAAAKFDGQIMADLMLRPSQHSAPRKWSG